jgi:hypothetical protein
MIGFEPGKQSRHHIQLDQPELVIDAVRQVIEAIQ